MVYTKYLHFEIYHTAPLLCKPFVLLKYLAFKESTNELHSLSFPFKQEDRKEKDSYKHVTSAPPLPCRPPPPI